MAFAEFAARRYDEAIEWAKRSMEERPDLAMAHRVLAASCAQAGRLEEARAALGEMLRLGPFSASTFRATYPAADPDFVERYIDGLRKAGLKE